MIDAGTAHSAFSSIHPAIFTIEVFTKNHSIFSVLLLEINIVMKHNRLTKFILATILFSGFVFTSCKKDETTPSVKSIAELAASTPDLSYLSAAINRAGLSATLTASGTYTVFAPTNEAFIAAGFATIDAINAADPTALSAILLYHTLGSTVVSSAVPAGPNAAVATLNTANIYLTSNSKGVFVNGTPVVTVDVSASNGVVHIIGKVLIPPAGNIVETAQAVPDLSYLVAAILRASTGSTDVAGVLSGTGPFTVFAPTNDAFIAAGFPTIDAINAADPDALAAILTYHVLNGWVFSSDLSDGLTPTMLNAGTVTINVTGGATVKGNSNASASNITAVDVVTTNGAVHIIDQVLLP